MSPKLVKFVLTIVLGIGLIYVMRMAWNFGANLNHHNKSCSKIKRPSLKTSQLIKNLGKARYRNKGAVARSKILDASEASIRVLLCMQRGPEVRVKCASEVSIRVLLYIQRVLESAKLRVRVKVKSSESSAES